MNTAHAFILRINPQMITLIHQVIILKLHLLLLLLKRLETNRFLRPATQWFDNTILQSAQ